MWDSSAPLGISAHQPPFHCAHSFATEGPSRLCPLPTAPCLQLSMLGGCTLLLLHTPKGIFPPTGGSLQSPLLTAQGSTAPSCSVGLFYLTPFCLYLPSPCNVKVLLGVLVSPQGWEGLSTLHWVSRCSRGWEPSGSAPPGPLLHFSGMG